MAERVDNYFQQGLALLDEGDYLNAIDLFSKALRLSLGNIGQIYLYRGEAFAHLERWDDALADFNAALREDVYMAEAYNERGNLWRFQKEYESALTDYGTTLRIDPNYFEAYYNRALAYEEMGELDLAENDLTETIALNPGVAAAYEVRGRIRAAKHDYNGAIADLQRYLRMGGGREYDNHSETQGFILSLRMHRFIRRLLRMKA